jgi:hypothetical protein
VKSLLAVVLALTSMTAASAQMVPGTQPTASAVGSDGAIQITATFRAPIEALADPRSVPTPTAQDAARRTLYNMAANECTVLAEFWKAECRLNSFSLYVPLYDIAPQPQPQAPSMFGTAIYELRLMSPTGR